MRKKFRMFATLTSMVLVLIVMSVGIWAATQATVSSTGGSLTFTAGSEVYAKVELDQVYEGTFGVDDSVEFGANNLDVDSDSLTLADYNFNTNGGKDYIFALKITNTNPTSCTLNAVLTLNGSYDSYTVQVSTDNTSYSEYSSKITYDAITNEQMIYVKIILNDKTVTSSGNIGFDIVLTNTQAQS